MGTRTGRDLTNQISYFFCTKEERAEIERLVKGGSVYPPLLDQGKYRQKASIIGQLKIIHALGMNHLELDFNPKHPYEAMYQKKRELFEEARDYATELGLTTSVHLSYSYTAASVCAPQKAHRNASVEMLKQEIDIAEVFGAKYLIIHGGVVPFWEADELNRPFLIKALVDSLSELAMYAQNKGMILELENNVVADNCFHEIEEVMEVIEQVNNKGYKLLFCFDIGHYITRKDIGKDISKLVKVMEDPMVAKYSTGLMHLNSYIPKEYDKDGKVKPGTGKYHPLLHKERSPLSLSDIKEHARLNNEIGTDVVIIESAARSFQEMLNMNEDLSHESQAILDCFGISHRIENFDLNEIVTSELIEKAKEIVDPLLKEGF